MRSNPAREARDPGDVAELLAANPGVSAKEELAALCATYGPPGIRDWLGGTAMKTDLKLPRFGVPPGATPRIPPNVYWEWVMQNILRAHRGGRLERLRSHPSRQPVDVRFELR